MMKERRKGMFDGVSLQISVAVGSVERAVHSVSSLDFYSNNFTSGFG